MSDGHPFTTVDVQFWYDEYYLGDLSQKDAPITIGGEDMQLEVVDELTYIVRFPAPNPLLALSIAKLTHGQWCGPTMAMPAHYLSQYIPHLTDDESLIDDAMADSGVDTWQQLHGGGVRPDGPIAGWWLNSELPVMNAWMSVNHLPKTLACNTQSLLSCS